MTKLKIRKSAKKRYKLISGKRFVRKMAFKAHLLMKKSNKQKRKLARTRLASKADTKKIRAMLGY